MVDEVIHDERADRRHARHREDLLVAVFQRPACRQFGVGGLCQRGARRLDLAIEVLQQGGVRRGSLGIRFVAACGQIVGRRLDRGAQPEGQVGDVPGQLAERHRLRVRPPPEVLLRHPLQHPSRRRELVIVLGEERLGDGHSAIVKTSTSKLKRQTPKALKFGV